MLFQNLGLEQSICQTLTLNGFTQPSQVQELCVPSILSGQDTICQAAAGTGKTLCFLTTILQHAINKIYPHELSKLDKNKQNVEVIQDIQNIHPFALIFIPTRELAIQIVDITTRLVKHLNCEDELLKEILQPHLFIGGLPIEHDRDILKLKRCSIVIGTLGRIMQLIQEKILSLHNIQMIVLDEVDKLFENKHFQPNFKKIMSQVIGKNQENKNPQLMSFSATYPQKQLELIISHMVKPKVVNIMKEQNYEKIQQYYMIVHQENELSNYQLKVNCIVNFLRKIEFCQTIVFYNDKNRGENLFNDLRGEGFKPIFIHGDQTQQDRIKVMHQVRRNKANLIVSTDLLSRGIDVDTLDLVIHFDVPNTNETYYHRIGRAGRFGTFGVSMVLYLESDKQKLEWLEQWNEEYVEKINEQLRQKKRKDSQEYQYFGEFLNGVSDWKQLDYKFYDESKFKYREEEEEQQIQEEIIIFDKNVKKKEIKQVIKQESSKHMCKQDQSQSQQVKEILNCEKCMEFIKRIEEFSNKKLIISNYLDQNQ